MRDVTWDGMAAMGTDGRVLRPSQTWSRVMDNANPSGYLTIPWPRANEASRAILLPPPRTDAPRIGWMPSSHTLRVPYRQTDVLFFASSLCTSWSTLCPSRDCRP